MPLYVVVFEMCVTVSNSVDDGNSSYIVHQWLDLDISPVICVNQVATVVTE